MYGLYKRFRTTKYPLVPTITNDGSEGTLLHSLVTSYVLSITIPNLNRRGLEYTTSGLEVLESYTAINLYLRIFSVNSILLRKPTRD